MKSKITLTIPFMMLLFSGCEKEYTVSVDPSLQSYVASFVEEGAIRDVEVDFEQNGLIATLEDVPGRTVAGQCHTVQHGPNRMVIDARQWSRMNAEDRELLIFHELGHCYLGRSHLDAVDALGRCISIMRSSIDACDLEYDSDTRTELLDELFSN